mmetsp:Transcript_21625/g.45146  ORF Transcript_21625/g.45146 Transcript_21625/m.45146 type:complete len:257 (-) Transcript_21625:123-893(-)
MRRGRRGRSRSWCCCQGSSMWWIVRITHVSGRSTVGRGWVLVVVISGSRRSIVVWHVRGRLIVRHVWHLLWIVHVASWRIRVSPLVRHWPTRLVMRVHLRIGRWLHRVVRLTFRWLLRRVSIAMPWILIAIWIAVLRHCMTLRGGGIWRLLRVWVGVLWLNATVASFVREVITMLLMRRLLRILYVFARCIVVLIAGSSLMVRSLVHWIGGRSAGSVVATAGLVIGRSKTVIAMFAMRAVVSPWIVSTAVPVASFH